MVFEQIQGQESAIKGLNNIISSGRIAHAYLFCGPSGVGKRTCACLFTKALKGELNIIEPDGHNLKIDQIRRLQKDISLTSRHRKVYLICEAEKMTEEAANCLLKVLEEPPTQSILIVLTINPYRLLTTVRSRCQIIHFHRLSDRVLHNLLEKYADELSSEKMELIVRISGGSLSQALNYLKQSDLEQKRQEVWQIVEQCATRSCDKIFALAGLLEETERDKVKENLSLLAGCYRDVLIWQKSRSTDLLLHQDRKTEIDRLSKLFAFSEVRACFNHIIRAIKEIEKNSNIKLVLENMFLQLCIREEEKECIQWLE